MYSPSITTRFLLLFFVASGSAGQILESQVAGEHIVIEDFEEYAEGDAPSRWKRPQIRERRVLVLPEKMERDDDYVEVVTDSSGKVGRVYVNDNTEQIARMNDDTLDWRLSDYPVLSWRWKVLQLPEGAREDRKKLNDSGAALYVTFPRKDWLGRPHTIKYVYSTTLPIGKRVRYGALWVVVVSEKDGNTGAWEHVEVNVQEDYKSIFGKPPPDKPLYIMIWSDSDNTGSKAEYLIDDIEAAMRVRR